MRGRLSAAGMVTIAAGIVLLVWLVQRVGLDQVWAGFRQIGWGLALIIALGGARFLMRALAWRTCVEPPDRLRLIDAAAASIAGDALGNLTPLGPIVGEPAKAAFVRRHVTLAAGVTALALENVLYALSAAAMIAAGMVALLFRFDLPRAIRDVGEAAIAVTLLLFGAALWLVWQRPAVVSRALERLLRARGSGSRVEVAIARVRQAEQQMYSFAARHAGRLPGLVGAELGFHALGVLEVHVTLWLMAGAPPPLLTSFILETTNRLVTVVFKFVPLRVGVDEAATALFTQILGLGTTVGVTLAIVRKARMLFWTAVGALLMVRHGLRSARAFDPS
ncbi:MAG TPA: lysylphosphatidylglycerol synthase domain-containing protein [Vicinamibacterales bacterium]|nr:lysylphosphatidylglycerol synthase domain-containing protein [Vicinamibacterales bacterium]